MKEGYSVSLREVIGTLRRRWVVVLVGWFVTLVAGWLAIHPTPVYKGISVITLRAPRSENLPNQFNDGRPSIALTGALISARLQSRSGELQLRQAGVVGKYALTPRNSGTSATPAYLIASVEVTNETGSARSALRGIEAIVSTFRSELDVIQGDWGVPADKWITVATLAPPSAAPILVLKSRALLGIAVLGFAASILIALRVDEFQARRGTRLRQRGPARPRWNLALGRRLAGR